MCFRTTNSNPIIYSFNMTNLAQVYLIIEYHWNNFLKRNYLPKIDEYSLRNQDQIGNTITI